MSKSLSEFKSRHAPDQEVEHLRAQLDDANNRLAQERKRTGEARVQMMEFVEALEAYPAADPDPAIGMFDGHKLGMEQNDVTLVVQLTDLHEGEVTHADEVDGFGEFNPDIFTQRLETLAGKLLNFVEVQRAGYCIPKLHILGTGDYISGDIHEELKVTNAYPAPVQAVNAGNKIGAFIASLAPHFERVSVDMLTLDNHGRMTKKNQAAEGGQNNWGFVVANIVKQRLSANSHVEVNIHAKPSALVEIGPERYLMMHGHQVKGWAGIPYYGFDRRVAMEAVKRMGYSEQAFTKIVMGHFHVAVDAPQWIIGGSLSGTNAFDHSCGRHSQAHQTSWLVHEKHGMFGFTRWWL